MSLPERGDPTPPPSAKRVMRWYSADRIALAGRLEIDPGLVDHGLAARALEAYLSTQRGGGGILDMMRHEEPYRGLVDASLHSHAVRWLEAQWEVPVIDVAAGKLCYRRDWIVASWEQVAADLSRALGLPFLRDASRRGLFGFRARYALIGFLTLREVREVLRALPNVDPTRFRGTSLRHDILEDIRDGLRNASENDAEMVILLT